MLLTFLHNVLKNQTITLNLKFYDFLQMFGFTNGNLVFTNEIL